MNDPHPPNGTRPDKLNLPPGLSNQDLVVLSTLVARNAFAAFLGKSFSGARDMYAVLGYPAQLEFDHFNAIYGRQDIAKRVVDYPAASTWRKPPVIRDAQSGTDQEEPESQFIRDLRFLIEKRRLWHYLQRADKMAGVGRYGILLIGLRDGGELADRVGKVRSGPASVLFFAPYSEGRAVFNDSDLDREPQSERFGLPTRYSVQLTDSQSYSVNWSRTIHIAEGLAEGEVYGTPRLEAVFNRFQDLEKVVGGGAEAQWINMRKGLQANVNPDFELPDAEALETEIDEYMHGLRRVMRTQGVELKELGADVVDPDKLFQVIVSLIAGATGIPKRLLLGAEMGELASSQDEGNWAGVIASRQSEFAEPAILRPTIDRLIQVGALAAPIGADYSVEWQPLFELNAVQLAELADKKASALERYAPPGASDTIVPPEEFREKFLGLPPRPDVVVDDLLDEEDRLEDDDAE